MLRIYGAAKSRALRTLWMAGELGLPYDHKDYLPRAPETRTPEYRALNPNGRVPTIDDDGFIVSESMAINFYLAKKHGSALYPSDPKHEALALQWSLWETDRLDRQLVNYVRHSREMPEAERKKEIADASWKEVAESLDVLETALAKSAWSTLSRVVPRSREMAARAGLAQSLLGASGRETGTRDAGVVGQAFRKGRERREAIASPRCAQ
jgi:glutathione S-transferase